MRESAAPTDSSYLLKHLDRTVFRFKAGPGGRQVSDAAAHVAAFVRDHPGTTVATIMLSVPALKDMHDHKVRDIIVGLVDQGIIVPDGRAPLEEVDPRYERVPTCDVCGDPSGSHPILFWKHNTPVVRCAACGLKYSNPRWKGEHLFSYYGDEYWADYAERIKKTALNVAANQARWDPYLSIVEPARSTGRLLDVGCATGEFLMAAGGRGWETHGLETAPIAAAHAEKVTGSPIHNGPLESADYPDGWFDVVTMWDVIEHVQSPSSYIKQAWRLLKPGGMLALTTPNIRSISYGILGRDWWVVGPNAHLYYFEPRTLTGLLKRSVFAIHYLSTENDKERSLHQRFGGPVSRLIAPAASRVLDVLGDRYLLGENLLSVNRKLG